jgi:hypothetical protein
VAHRRGIMSSIKRQSARQRNVIVDHIGVYKESNLLSTGSGVLRHSCFTLQMSICYPPRAGSCICLSSVVFGPSRVIQRTSKSSYFFARSRSGERSRSGCCMIANIRVRFQYNNGNHLSLSFRCMCATGRATFAKSQRTQTREPLACNTDYARC